MPLPDLSFWHRGGSLLTPEFLYGGKMDEYILKMSNISKSFYGTPALTSVNLNVKKGTVHALMGENGAGKSTLMKILLGIYSADQGEIWFKGERMVNKHVNDALLSGIAMIHQELTPISQMTVAENVFLGREPVKNGVVQDTVQIQNTRKLFEDLHVHIDPKEKMCNLSTSYVQMVEIAKAISYNANLIIMDEPTSAITESEVSVLFQIINRLVTEGRTVIYITHKMDEVFEIANEVTVLRDGNNVDTLPVENLTKNQLIEMMVGRKLTQMYPEAGAQRGEILLSVKNLTKHGQFENVSFDVYAGERLGIAGLVGAGRSELLSCIYGLTQPDSGEIVIKGKKVNITSAGMAIKHGMALVTEDRRESGLFMPLSVVDNLTIVNLPKYISKGFILWKKVIEDCKAGIKKLNIKTTGPLQMISNLSGGNQQKVILARWLLIDPDIFFIDEPTRGIDVGSKNEIYEILNQLVREGKAVIMVSSELPEVIGMSDRVCVMHEGKMTGTLEKDEITQVNIMRLATDTDEDKRCEVDEHER